MKCLSRTVSCVGEVGLAFVWKEAVEQSADSLPGRVKSPLCGLAQELFELGEDLLDRVEIGAIGQEEKEPCTGSPDRGADGLAFVAAQIVENDDVASLQHGDEDLLD